MSSSFIKTLIRSVIQLNMASILTTSTKINLVNDNYVDSMFRTTINRH